MRVWIALSAIALLLFGAVGSLCLLFSVVAWSWGGLFVNLLIIGLGAADLYHLRLSRQHPETAYRRMAATQGVLGILLALLLGRLAFVFPALMEDEAILREVFINLSNLPGYEQVTMAKVRDVVAQIKPIAVGLSAAGVLLALISQFLICWGLLRLARPAKFPILAR